MNGTDLLAEFRATRAEADFSELVRRYTNLVYSIAKRRVSVTYYTSPVLLVRAVAEDGTATPGFKCKLVYSNDQKPHEQPPNWISGVGGDVDFEKQQDGRWRSQSLLPDENVILTVEAAGFQPWSQSMSLSEGATQEVEAKLQKQ